jgi:hypothetical protein
MFCTKKIKNNKKYVKNGKMLAHVIFSSYFCGVKKEYKKRSEKITPFFIPKSQSPQPLPQFYTPNHTSL